MKKAVKYIFMLLALIAIIGGGLFYYNYSQYTKALTEQNSDSSEKVTFEVTPGEPIESIANGLVTTGLLKEENEDFFVLYIKKEGLYAGMQAGAFIIPMNLTIEELGQTLQTAGLPEIWVTIPEGLRADEISELFALEFSSVENSQYDKNEFMRLVTDKEFISQQDLTSDNTELETLEGFLFPDKYLLAEDTTTEQLVSLMLENFKTRVGEDITYDQLILASLVEKEGRTEEDRKLVADVIQKRVDEGWLLGLDVTLLYYHNDWLRVLTVEDLADDHAYNSRLRTGLPPTPICNPGVMSINAALHPTENDYYYFIATEDDGTMYFAKTQAEHEAYVQEYLR